MGVAKQLQNKSRFASHPSQKRVTLTQFEISIQLSDRDRHNKDNSTKMPWAASFVCLLALTASLARAQISNTDSAECEGVFDFYFVIDS